MRLDVARTWDGAPARADEIAVVTVRRGSRAIHLEIDAPLHGDPSPGAVAGATGGLWEHEVVEVFLATRDERYVEVEIGPAGHHLALALQGRRRVVASHLPLAVSVRRAGARWTARAALDLRWVPAPLALANAYAIHGVAAERRHLAHAPVGGALPDFHRLERFVPFRE